MFYAQPTSAVTSGRASKLVFYTQSTSVSGRRRRKQRRERKKENKERRRREKAGNGSHGRMPTWEQREEKTRPTVVCTGQQREIMDKTQTVRNQRCLFGANYGMKHRQKLPPELRPPLLNLSIGKPSSTQSLFGSENSFPCLNT